MPVVRAWPTPSTLMRRVLRQVADDLGDDGGRLGGADVESGDEAVGIHGGKAGDHLVTVAEVELDGAQPAPREIGFDRFQIGKPVAT